MGKSPSFKHAVYGHDGSRHYFLPPKQDPRSILHQCCLEREIEKAQLDGKEAIEEINRIQSTKSKGLGPGQ